MLQRLGLSDERAERVPLAELDRTVDSRSPHHALRRGRCPCIGRGRRGRPVAAAHQAAAEPGWMPVGCRADAPVADPLPARSRSGGGARRPARSRRVHRARRRARRPPLSGRVPRPARRGGRWFAFADVARGFRDKMVRRHPHVFGDVVADKTPTSVRNWEQIKKVEKGTTSIVEGITPGLPSLLYTHKLFRKARVGRARPRRPRRGARPLSTSRWAVSATRRRRPRGRPRAAARGRGGHRARGWRRRRVRACRSSAARYRAPLRGDGVPRRERGLDLATLDATAVTALWLEAVSRG